MLVALATFALLAAFRVPAALAILNERWMLAVRALRLSRRGACGARGACNACDACGA